MYVPDGSDRTIIPAQPGWFVAWPWRDKATKESGVTLDSVIAWMIVYGAGEYHRGVPHGVDEKPVYAHTYPITADGVEEMEQSCLKDPLGRFVIPSDRTYETEEVLLAEWKWKS